MSSELTAEKARQYSKDSLFAIKHGVGRRVHGIFLMEFASGLMI